MFRFLKALIAAKKLFTLGGKISGELEALDIQIQDGEQFIDLPLNADTIPSGRQSLFWDSRSGHLVVEALDLTNASYRRYKVLKSFGKALKLGDKVWLSGWLGEKPEDFFLEGIQEILMPNNTLAYFAPADSDWVIHVHGRNASRAETLRNFRAIANLGFSQLSVSLESDSAPNGLGTRRSNLGSTEWREVELAVQFAKDNGAKNIVLFGFSLGAMICGEFTLQSNLRKFVSGLVFDSPLIDFESTLNLQASRAGHGQGFGSFGLLMVRTSRLFKLFRLRVDPIPTLVRPLGIRSLVFFSQADGYVSMDRMPQMQALNPQSRFVHFSMGRHCRLYNQDPDLYEKHLIDYLSSFRT